VYGANTKSVLNGSMGFDDYTLQPTYVLRLGAPGKSAGLDIATRLGMPKRVIDRARLAMSTTERDIAQFLSEMQARLERTTALERSLEEKLADVLAKEITLKQEWERKGTQKIREIERKYEELAARFEAQAKETIASLPALADQKKAAEQALRKVARTRREFHEQLET